MVIPWHSELLLVLYMAEPPKTKSGIRLPYYYLLYPDETILLLDILFDPILHRVRPQCGPEKMGYKIREARLARVPYMLIVGAKEEEEGKVSVRSRYLGDEGMKDLGDFLAAIKEEIKNKTIRKIEVQEENK